MCSLIFITGRNEVVAKVIFLQVCLSFCSQGGSATVHAGMPPPLPRRPPCQGNPLPKRPPAKETPHQGDPPAKETPCQGDPPAAKETPPEKQTLAYGQ